MVTVTVTVTATTVIVMALLSSQKPSVSKPFILKSYSNKAVNYSSLTTGKVTQR